MQKEIKPGLPVCLPRSKEDCCLAVTGNPDLRDQDVLAQTLGYIRRNHDRHTTVDQ